MFKEKFLNMDRIQEDGPPFTSFHILKNKILKTG